MEKHTIKKTNIMTTLGKLTLLAILIAPLYQEMTAVRSHSKDFVVGNVVVETNESTVTYGDNLLQGILGIKTVHEVSNYHSVGASSSTLSSTTIQTPSWMQKIGCKKEVSWGKGFVHSSSIMDNVYVVALRLLVKLSFLLFLLFLSALIEAVYSRRWLFLFLG